jgi:superfamily II DNA or RNA helicase
MIFSEIAKASTKKVLILAHRKELIEQASERIGVPHGIIMSGVATDYTQRIQIASVMTMANRLDKFCPEFIIVDECHHAVAGSWEKITSAYPNAFILGVTATPCRLDGKGLKQAFDCLIEGPNIKTLIDLNFLVNPKTYASQNDFSKIKTTAGDYDKKDIYEAFNKPSITGSAIESWRKYAEDLPTVVFCINIKHAEDIAGLFSMVGHTAEVVHGGLDKTERAERLNRLKTGETKIITSVDIISEGTDIPAVGCIIMMRPTKSLALYLQQAGRGLRTIEGKNNCIILDHAGNCFRHGLVTDLRDWELTDTKIKEAKKTFTIRQCKKCYAVFGVLADKCPECGAEVEKQPKEMKKIAGELVPIDEIPQKKIQAKQEEWSCKTLAQWERVAFLRGYKKGWAFIRYEEQQRRQNGGFRN